MDKYKQQMITLLAYHDHTRDEIISRMADYIYKNYKIKLRFNYATIEQDSCYMVFHDHWGSEILYNAFLVAMEEYFEMDRKKNYYQLSKFIEENVSITGKNNNIIAISLNNVRHSLDDEITKFKNIDITKDQIICQFLQIIRNNIDIIIAGMYSSPNTLPSTYWHNIYSNINKNKIVIKNPTVNNNELVQLFKNSVEQFILSLDTELIVPFDDVIDRCYNIKANNINEDNTLFIEISYQPE